MRIHHVAFRTDDIPRLERFYVDVLGFTVTRRSGSVWLDAGGAIVMLEQRAPGEPPIPAGSMEIVTFGIEPHQSAEYMHRLDVEGRTDFTLYVRDPDGRRIGLSSYPEPLALGP